MRAFAIQIITTSLELDDFLAAQAHQGMSADGLNMAESYIRSCWDKGVEVVLDPSLTSAFGTYDAAGNVLTLGGPALADPVQLIETLEHEFIHVLQDEMSGLANADMATLGLPTTTEAIHAVAHGYGHTSAEVQQLELEAHSAEHLLQNPETVLSRTPLGLEQELAVAYSAHGMTPLEASLQASLDAPLLEAFLG